MRKRMILLSLVAWLMSVTVFAQGCDTHDFVLYEELPGCTTIGFRCYICSICGESDGYENLPLLGHDYGEWVEVAAPACDEAGAEQCVCVRCKELVEREIPALGHSFEESYQAPSCKAEGYTLLVCSVCNHRETQDKVDPLGHDYQSTVTDPTCTADGYTRHVCSRCDDAYRTDSTEKLGHEFGEGVETREPTLTTKGRITYTCIRCDHSYTETTPMWTNPFLDLDKKAYYFDSILWACSKGITKGVAADLFGPEENCTRAQVVTFLWRQAGNPEPCKETVNFTDVPSDAYYRDAVYWALEQGITNGVSANEFAPDRICTRAEVVTFLYRAHGGETCGGSGVFVDVPVGSFYYNSVYWAYETGITTGTGPWSFSPNLECTRAQIVTFLYRARKLE